MRFFQHNEFTTFLKSQISRGFFGLSVNYKKISGKFKVFSKNNIIYKKFLLKYPNFHFYQHQTSKHTYPPLPTDEELPEELHDDKIPDFVAELQELSRKHPFSNDKPTRTEIVDTLAKLKNRKSSNDVPPEILKYARESSRFIDRLTFLIHQVWDEKTVPKAWANGKVEALWKGKGSKSDPAMYRA